MAEPSRTHKATRWNAVGRGVDAAVRYGVVLILVQRGWMTNLDWGFLEAGLLVTGFVDQFVDLGTGQAVIQRATLPHRFTSTIFWFNLAVGLVLSCLLFLAAGPLAAGLGVPEARGVIRLLSPTFLLLGGGIVQRCLLSREMEFEGLSKVNALAAVAHGCVALVLASRGKGAMALAFGTLASSAVQCLGYWQLSPWRPSFQFDSRYLRETWRFSSNLLGANLGSYLLSRGDRLLAARFLGPESLGLLALARRIVLQPARQLPMIVVGTLIPSLAEVKADLGRLRDRYERALDGLGFLIVPALTGIALTSDLLLRSRGESADPRVLELIWILLPFALCHAHLALSGPVFVALGRTDLMLRVGLGLGLWLLLIQTLALQFEASTSALAYGLSGAMAVGFPLAIAAPIRLAGGRLWPTLKRRSGALGGTLGMALAVLGIRGLARESGLPWSLELPLAAGAGALAYAVLALGLRPRGASEFLRLVGLHSLSARTAPRG